MGSDPHKYLNEVTVNSFEAMQLSLRLKSQLKTRMLTYIQQENAPIKVSFTLFLVVITFLISPLHLNFSYTRFSLNSS